jgi:AcrR family transcriptional regulator
MSGTDPTAKRSYVSPKREQAARETRRRIREAGAELFLRDGYLPTSMAAIARSAGVSERSVYLAYESKAALLNEIIVVGVRGDDQLSSLSDREDTVPIERATSGTELITGFTRAAVGVLERAAPLMALGEAAAGTDPALGVERDRAHAAQRSDMYAIAERIHALGELRQGLDVDTAADILCAVALNEGAYLRFTDEAGHAPDQYVDLLSRMLTAAVLGEPTRESARRLSSD